MTTRDPKAARRRARAKRRRKGMHDLKMLTVGILIGAFGISMIFLSQGVFNHPEQSPTNATTATVVHKAYAKPKPHRAEDGTEVPPGYYRHRAGPTQAVCDYLGKTLVPDATYGTRCV